MYKENHKKLEEHGQLQVRLAGLQDLCKQKDEDYKSEKRKAEKLDGQVKTLKTQHQQEQLKLSEDLSKAQNQHKGQINRLNAEIDALQV